MKKLKKLIKYENIFNDLESQINSLKSIKRDCLLKEEIYQKELELLERKRQRNESNTDIVYDANKKKIVNSFIPNLEELNEFLKNCTIKEIDINDIQNEIEKLPKEKIFDPESFIEANYGKNEKNKKNDKKNSFSIEELGLDLNNDINNIISKEEEPKEKNEEKNILNEILLERDLLNDEEDIDIKNNEKVTSPIKKVAWKIPIIKIKIYINQYLLYVKILFVHVVPYHFANF